MLPDISWMSDEICKLLVYFVPGAMLALNGEIENLVFCFENKNFISVTVRTRTSTYLTWY